MSNDTREALAAEAKDAVRRVRLVCTGADYSIHDRAAAVDEAFATIDRLAALTEQPAAPRHVATVRVMRTGGNAGIAWHAVPTDDAPLLPDGTKLYDRPSAPQGVQAEPVAWTLKETLVKRETTTRGYLWFTDPQNSSWAPLYAAPAAPAQEPQQPAPHVRPLLDIATSLAEHLHQVQDWIEEHLAAAASSLAPAASAPDYALLNRLIELGADAAGYHAKANSDDGHAGTEALEKWRAIREEMHSLISSPAPAVHPDVSAERRLRRLITAPAPAVQPTEAVAELVEALQRARDVIEGCDYPVDTSIDRALAKHGQPQGAPAVQPLTMGRIYEVWHEIGADVAGLSWAKFAEALQHGQPQGGSNG